MAKKLESEYERQARLKHAKFIFTKTKLIIFICVILGFALTIFLRPWYQGVVNSALGFNAWQSRIEVDDLQIHIIAVGQGDAIAIRLPDNRTMLIDAGQESESGKLKQYLDNVFFSASKEKVLDYVLLTHSDSDHCGGMQMVYANYDVKCSLRPVTYSLNALNEQTMYDADVLTTDNLYYASYINAIYNENSRVIYASKMLNYHFYPNGYIVGKDKNNNDYSIIFLTNNHNYYNEINNSSTVILIQYLGRNLLFTGDAEDECFDEIDDALSCLNIEKIDFYKASHHGSSVNDCNRESTLFRLTPNYVAISVGKDNSYGHPHQAFLDTLQLLNIDDNHLMRTDKHGSCVFGIKENGEIMACKYVPRKMMLEYVWELTFLAVVIITYYVCFYNRKRERENDEDNIF